MRQGKNSSKVPNINTIMTMQRKQDMVPYTIFPKFRIRCYVGVTISTCNMHGIFVHLGIFYICKSQTFLR